MIGYRAMALNEKNFSLIKGFKLVVLLLNKVSFGAPIILFFLKNKETPLLLLYSRTNTRSYYTNLLERRFISTIVLV
jgi:hypothetical protein